MIDAFHILHRGGAVLWENTLVQLQPDLVNDWISRVLLEERSSKVSYKLDKWTLKWQFINELDLIFVAVYLNITNLLYIDELIEKVKQEFLSLIKSNTALSTSFQTLNFPKHIEFDSKYRNIVNSFEQSSKANSISYHKPRTLEQNKNNENSEKDNEATPSTNQSTNDHTTNTPDFNVEKLRQMQMSVQRGGAPRPMRTGAPKKKSGSKKEEVTEEDSAKKKRVKQATTWDNKINKEDAAALDRSADDAKESALSGAELAKLRGFIDENDSQVIPTYDDDESDDDQSTNEVEEDNPSTNRLFGYFSRLVGNAPLTRKDLEPVLEDFQQSLMSKNVAQEIAAQLCESVLKSLEGKKPGSFVSVKATVRSAIEEALTRILTPGKQVDILQAIHVAKAEKRPYSIVFLGVNGVGKSTSLAKTGAYLLSKGLSVGIAACDTFRSGAIEQLRTHCTCLGITLYAKGYDRDAAAVCADAIVQAKRDGKDVVLVDTAGRMQDNEPLMRALAKLINMNQPDLVLFVGEALVGNDAVDQAAKFNRCLSDLSGDATPRLIDGIILTKFDTIDDKVGAAISMAYTTGRPIMFVGTGQTYKDLKRMNVKTLVKALLG